MTVLVDLPAIPQSRRLDGPPMRSLVGVETDLQVRQCGYDVNRATEALLNLENWNKKHMILDAPSLGNDSRGLQKMRMSTKWPREPVKTNVEVDSSSLGSSGS